MTNNTSLKSLHLTMESLDLPRELYWGGKLEPAASPPPSTVASELFALDENIHWLLDDTNFANGITLMDEDEENDLKQTNIGQLLSDEDLVVEFLDLKHDEECLLDQKLPQYNGLDYEISLQTVIDVVAQSQSQPLIPITKVQAATAEMYHGQYEAAGAELLQLTPPQSPPQCIKQEQKALIYATDATTTTATTTTNYNFNSWAGGVQPAVSGSSNEIERETQLVDEIVKIRAQELPNWQQYNDDCESQASVSCAGSSSSVSEWAPESNGSSPCYQSSSGGLEEQQTSAPSSPAASDGAGSASKKRTRPYGRGVEDRKIRKKEQNKNAATRYRQKKKIEMEHVQSEEQELAQENAELRRTLADRRHELRYLRQLIREFYKGRKP